MDAVINGIPLIALILGLVEFAKELGLTGKPSLILAAVLGIGFGLGYQVSIAMPTGFAGWFEAAVVGLAWGLAASGVYDFAKKLAAATK